MFDKLDFITEKYNELAEKVADPAVIADQKTWQKHMKEGIHPGYKECKVTCACGNTFMTLSDKAEMRVDICSECHPFFTGQQKFANRGGRVEKFKNKYGL